MYCLARTLNIKSAATPAQWRSRSIYRVLTDRFALTDGPTSASCNTENRLIKKLDYIQGVGFTAVWISPIVKNIPRPQPMAKPITATGAQDINSLNEHFGSAADLKALCNALHACGMYLMVDVAPNHFAYAGSGTAVGYRKFVPFNSQSYFDSFCWVANYNDQNMVEERWLGDNSVSLPDVDTNQPFVQSTYNTWIQNLVLTYRIDGLRIDTAKHVEESFWDSSNNAAGIYAVGEVYSGDKAYTCGYQSASMVFSTSQCEYHFYEQVDTRPNRLQLLSSTESLPIHEWEILELVSMISNVKDNCLDSTLLGTFSENHDIPRFASYTVYAGQEQHYAGGNNPYNREATWLSGCSTTSTLYRHIASLNQIRNQAIYKSGDSYLTYKNWVIYPSGNALATRKSYDNAAIIIVLNNMGSNGCANTFTLANTRYSQGATIYDVLSCTSVTAGSGGTVHVSTTAGLPKVFYPAAMLSGSGICGL
ncbi:family 13 alpha amylase in complex with acarbose [Choiromyces venosus 120613-1]|uniref:alpha-amylase n=1 Tax=Choiromyces venosus 120613-1 TaxID=1336337 RepID=A0A3N4JLC9_9PEZI|nr:family 13 alpha amylase in complex with acarbose [Choiromyces venosus 120613-1]